MDERFRLVFRGETVDGQHAAVVKKKLGKVMKIAEAAKLDALFSGKPVVIRRDCDKAQAAKFQAAFKLAGARLRVLPVVLSVEELEAQEAADQARAEAEALERAREAAPEQADFTDSAKWALMPAGTPMIEEEEREETEPVNVPTEHIKMERPAAFVVDEDEEEESAPQVEIDAPDFDIAEPGATMGAEDGGTGIPLMDVEVETDLTIAEPGVELVKPSAPIEIAENLMELPFNVAEPGADIGEASLVVTPPPAPDVSHLELVPDTEPEPEKLDARKVFGVVSDEDLHEEGLPAQARDASS